MLFQDREDAGRQLARALMTYKSRHPVILALPRGGVPVAAEVAERLDAPLDLILVRKIGAPMQPELAMGAVVDGEQPVIVRNQDVIELAGVSERTFDAVCKEELDEIERRRARYLGDRARSDVKGQVAIIVDDGIATGATTLAAIRALRKRDPKELVLAVPVAPLETLQRLHAEVDAIVCLDTPPDFGAIGYYYRDFRQVGDEEVIALLKRFPAKRTTTPASGFPASGWT
ncbi:phosphoribosyltransferase [Bradyrhizobium nanningense]|uniref:Phosphoribosyltransferase n=1 Tax=Bradyrhizobium nanningense TaxID=1325118 RepID=A0A4Q0SG07_9BRAD|nr:phosphoribosyltransferase [Bradyrhizobium nanningense]RXH23972.1 phosphoribosyltransferase [Bradyrhizobium nanningense]RXH38433.1 phosphoribosyltransferase [Bradyrhizobium nanningense]